MAGYYDDLISNYCERDPINDLVFQITTCIKNKQDYGLAIKIILENNLKLDDVVSRTIRLTLKDVVELANRLILSKS